MSLDPLVEYSKQIILENLTQITERIAAQMKEGGTLDISKITPSYNIEIAINCLKESPNPQTHNNVLLLLASLGQVLPDLVLKHALTLFTFVGTSSLQQDDSYSFFVAQKVNFPHHFFFTKGLTFFF